MSQFVFNLTIQTQDNQEEKRDIKEISIPTVAHIEMSPGHLAKSYQLLLVIVCSTGRV